MSTPYITHEQNYACVACDNPAVQVREEFDDGTVLWTVHPRNHAKNCPNYADIPAYTSHRPAHESVDLAEVERYLNGVKDEELFRIFARELRRREVVKERAENMVILSANLTGYNPAQAKAKILIGVLAYLEDLHE